MSYGTIIYPKVEDFSEIANLSEEELKGSIDAEVRFMANRFNEFRALAFCTPYDTFGKEAYEKIRKLVDQYFEDYVESYAFNFKLGNILDLKEQLNIINKEPVHEDGTRKVAYLYFNRFTYSNVYGAESSIESNVKELLKIKGKILSLCLATPIDITPRDQEQYSDGHEEPLYYLSNELDALEDYLDDCLSSIHIAKMVIKYWDGHKEG